MAANHRLPEHRYNSIEPVMRFFWQDKILYENKTKDMTVQVIQRDDRRELCFGNHITQSAVSLSNPDILQLDYTRAMMAAFMFSPQAANILHLGLGAGSLAKFIHGHFPQSRQVVVELSPAVIEVAYKYFFLPQSPRLEVKQDDGERFLKSCDTQFEMIFQDAFHAEGVSHHLESVEFFENVRDHLQSDGWLVNNVWGSNRENLNLVKQHLNRVFSQLYAVSVRAESNVIFFCCNSPRGLSPAKINENAHRLSQTTGLDIVRFAEQLKTIKPG